MGKRGRLVLWVLLVVTLALAGSGAYLRISNEEKNKNIVTAVDYREFLKMCNAGNADIDQVLTRLKSAGVKTVGVKEVSLRDLAYTGDIYLTPYGEFLAFNRLYKPEIYKVCLKAAGTSQISPDRLVVTADRKDTQEFLSRRLASRFNPAQVISFASEGRRYYIINAELLQLDKPKESNNKNTGTFMEPDLRLGFDNTLLSRLYNQGFDIILRPDNNSTATRFDYLDEFEQAVRDYDVKYVVFGSEVPGYPDHLQRMEDIVQRYHLIVGIIETSAQLQYINQPGLEQLMLDTSYPINRVYSSTNDEFVQTVDERYYRWVRAVIDRGIRILYVSPFKDAKLSYSDNIQNTVTTLERFQTAIQAKGFHTDQALPRLSSQIPGAFNGLMLALSLVLAALLYLHYLFQPQPRTILFLSVLGVVSCLALTLVLHRDLTQMYALAAAILYPSFSSLLLLLYLRNFPQHGVALKILVSLAIILPVNMLGAYTVISSLADIRYIMNVFIFRGVKLAFILPLVLFVVNYFACFAGESGFRERAAQVLQMQPTYLVLLILGILAMAGYYYLGRSGNAVVQVSGLEIKLRETLETWFLARPRFKEIIIGYPALFAMVYLYHRCRKNFIPLLLGLGVVMGSISMVNSFCHVFTAVSISASRTLGGLMLGLITGISSILGIYIIEVIWKRFIVQD
ncbi:DUF5693 family protein [Syntrophomonas palmitatica]|uniref:DUF5693 family protein n=1 Tax=Syntrophomonas palmitatica TaxID=402877 RepID=UPI0006D28077|nr:DUF5693 family protein [Syntrophomonas palmitatica]